MSRLFPALSLAIFSASCSSQDATGRDLTDQEIDAIDTCNDWLDEKIRGNLGYIHLDEAIVIDSESSIDVGWYVHTSRGSSLSMCSTNKTGTRVIGDVVDGLEVQP